MSTQTDIILNRIYASAAEQKASEIYLIGAQIPFIRAEGKVRPLVDQGILAVSFIQEIIASQLNPDEQKELEAKKQIMVVKKLAKVGASQINVYYQKGTPAIRLKLPPQEATTSQGIVDLDRLEVPKMVKEFADFSRGIVFITGPRDSGRFSLMAALVNHINKTQAKYIATVERPIKYSLVGAKSVIEQREVGKDVPSFLDGLRFIRERNVDVVIVSHIEDAEIIRELFAIAEAGSLVFGVMDTGSAYTTIKKILHLFPASEEADIRYFLSENLGGIISNRMVPRIGGGRIRAVEVLPGIPAVRTIIAEGKLHQLTNILQAGESQRSISLDQYLADLVTSNKIMLEEAIKYCIDEEMVRSLLRR